MILILRSTLFFILQSILTVIIASCALCLFWTPYLWRYRFITSWSHAVIWLAKVICRVDYQVIGIEYLPNKPAIVLCNHQSAWETLFLQVLLPPQTWVLKKQLLNIPFFGWGLRLLEPIAIDRTKSSSAKQLLTQGQEKLNQGRWVVLFPQGTRVPVGQEVPFSRSGTLLAQKTQHLIVPIAHNAGLYWPKSAFIKKPGRIKVIIGKPLDPTLMSADTLQQAVQTWINNTAKELITDDFLASFK